MSQISPEAQSLIDRLTRMDPADPRRDEAAVERAIMAHLAALGAPARPVVWAEDAASGCRRLSAAARAAYWAGKAAAREAGAKRKAFRRAARKAAESAIVDPMWKRAFMRVLDARGANVRRKAAGDALRRLAFPQACWRLGGLFQRGLLDERVGGRHNFHSENAWMVRIGVRHCIGDAVRSVDLADDLAAISRPELARAVDVIGPLFDAFESGLFLYWITSCEIVCVPQPSISLVGGRLHGVPGPAVRWRSGETHHFWNGVQVPSWIIEEPGRIAVATIRAEPNQEIRRCMTEIYGLGRYLRDADARLIHEDECGKLWEFQVGDEAWRVVEVHDGSVGPDGTRRIYVLDVTCAEEQLGWPIATAHAAVAATYGLRPWEYVLKRRT